MAITNGYATLTEVKLFLGITDSVDDTLLEGMVEAASRSIDRMANRRFYLDTNASARLYRANDALQLFVDDIGSATGLAVAIDSDGNGSYDTALTLNTDYILDPITAPSLNRPWNVVTIVSASAAFPAPLNYRPGVQVTAKWGWPSIPDDINQACMILTADLYKRKDAPGGIIGLGDLGAIRMSPVGRDITQMVRAYRREVLA
jgi:hypothetical protein